MSEEDARIDLALRLERISLGWALDAERYMGRRRQWRLDRATRLRHLAESLIY